ncbi:SpoIIE family protein phosphatase [Streptomyces sp. NPDC016566]|uniref:ATP-binding SpoIIE family protein phosphatase n=1 Tax=Streptomyces sp. NPDC016566 TaxID=3364967 RepID=UPI0036FB661A
MGMRDTALLGTSSDAPEPAGDVCVVVGEHGSLLGWGPAAQHLLGYSSSELWELRWADLVEPGTEAAELLDRRPDGRPIVFSPARLRHSSGSRVEARIWAHGLVTPAGAQWLIQAEPLEDARRNDLRRALLRGLFTESPYIIDVFDSDLRFLGQNESRSRSGGFADEVVGRTMREAAPSGLLDVDALEERQRRVLDTGRASIGVEVRGGIPEGPGGESVWSETIVPLRSGSGDVVGLVHLVINVTEETRARERLDLINEASARIGSSLDVMQTAQELTDVAVPQFADYAYVDLLDPVLGGRNADVGLLGEGAPLRRAAHTVRAGGPLDTRVARGEIDLIASAPESSATKALADGNHVLLTGDELFEEFISDPARAALHRSRRVHSWLLVPMYARGEALGTVTFARYQRLQPFEADDILLAKEFAARAGVCIDNASRYTHERSRALALQRSLLPRRLPALRCVETASRYLPANGHTVLGGAWFDVIRLSSARVGLVVANAVGQGLRSAVTMSALRTAVRTLADLDLSPDELLTELNEQIKRFHHEQGAGNDAVGTTCTYAVFDPLSRHCELASAGHPSPALLPELGEATVIEMPVGPPLGTGGAPYECGGLTLADGDLLVLDTMGLANLDGDDAGTGLERLRDVLSAARAARPSPAASTRQGLGEFCDEVLRRMVPCPAQQDMALLVARVRGLESERHVTWDLPAEFEVVRKARELAGRTLRDWGLEEMQFTTELLVSELVTNAVRYGLPPIRLRLIRDRNLICEVSDHSSTSPHVRRALDTDEGGRGLFLVSQTADLWGTRYHARGKSIWAEQSLRTPPGD